MPEYFIDFGTVVIDAKNQEEADKVADDLVRGTIITVDTVYENT